MPAYHALQNREFWSGKLELPNGIALVFWVVWLAPVAALLMLLRRETIVRSALGQPALFFGVPAGNRDTLVNRSPSDTRLRHNDAYTPNDEGGKRAGRAWRRRPRRSVRRSVSR